MKKKVTIVYLIGFFMFLSNVICAQIDPGVLSTPAKVQSQATDSLQPTYGETIYNVFITARSYGDSIVLRWAPDKAAVWLLGNSYGWNIERDKQDSEFTSDNDSVFVKILNKEPIRPLTLDQMKQRYDSTNLFIGAAAQALYGPATFQVSENDPNMVNYIFRKNQEQEQRQVMAYLAAEGHPDVADALGLRYVDKDVHEGQWYNYSIVSLIPGEYAKVIQKSILIQCKPFVRSEDEKVPEINIIQKDAFTAVIYWQRNKLSGYYVEKSIDKGKNWLPLNQRPVFATNPDQETEAVFGKDISDLMKSNAIYMDSLDLNKTYLFRVRGFDAFGDYAPYNQSEPFEMADIIPPTPPIMVNALPTDNKICTVLWRKDTIEKDLKGYVLTFSESPDGPWSKVSDLISPKKFDYTDNQAGERGRGYYRLFATDESGNVSFSSSITNNIEDTKAPSAPTAFHAFIDTAGTTYFSWNKNPEKDVLGYRIYFANELDHEFVERSHGIIDTLIYVDTIDKHTITPYVYFYIIAEDNSHNLSKTSDTIAVPVPDIVPPGVALLKNYTQTDESVTFKWLKSVSSDVAFYYIYRKPKNQAQWQIAKVFTPNQIPTDTITFTDEPLISQIAYNYCIEVIDRSKLTSGKTGITTVYLKGPNLIKVPIDIKASSNSKTHAVDLSWQYEYKSDLDHYGVLYKSVNGGDFTDVYSFQRGETSYTDSTVKPGDIVTYYVQLFLGKGKRSFPSKQIKVAVK